jgi:hypothetical protein
MGSAGSVIPVEHAVASHAAIPGSRLEIFEDVGHFPHCEAAARFAEVLVDFMTSTVPRARVGAALAGVVPAASPKRSRWRHPPVRRPDRGERRLSHRGGALRARNGSTFLLTLAERGTAPGGGRVRELP